MPALDSAAPRGLMPGVVAAIALASALGPAPAAATTVRAMSLLEKTQAAPVVVHATVERVETQWAVPEASIETLVTVKIIEAIKGGFEKDDRLTFRRGGGRIGDFVQTAPGLSEYEVGEEVILFLEPLGATFVAIGIGIGKYDVEQIGPGKYVTHDPRVAQYRYDERLEKPIVEPHPRMTPEPLSEFLKRVRSYARGFVKPNRIDPALGLEVKPKPEVTPLP